MQSETGFDIQIPIYSHFPQEDGVTRVEIPVYKSQKVRTEWTQPTLFTIFPVSLSHQEDKGVAADNDHAQPPGLDDSEYAAPNLSYFFFPHADSILQLTVKYHARLCGGGK